MVNQKLKEAFSLVMDASSANTALIFRGLVEDGAPNDEIYEYLQPKVGDAVAASIVEKI